MLFPRVGSQILIEPGSPEDFHVMEVKNVSRDGLSVSHFEEIASPAGKQAKFLFSGFELAAWEAGPGRTHFVALIACCVVGASVEPRWRPRCLRLAGGTCIVAGADVGLFGRRRRRVVFRGRGPLS